MEPEKKVDPNAKPDGKPIDGIPAGGGADDKTFDWGGKKLTADEIYVEAKGLFTSKSQADQILNNPEKLAEYYNEKYADKDPPDDGKTKPTPDAQQLAIRQQLKEAGVVFIDDPESLEKAGLMTNDQYLEDRGALKEEIRVEGRFNDLAKKIDGSDGRPAFSQQEIANFLQEKGFIGNEITTDVLNRAYEQLHEPKLKEWRAVKAKELKDAKPGQVFDERGGGSGKKEPSEITEKITFDGSGDSITPAEAAAKLGH